MISAAVGSSLRVLRMRPAGCSGVSVGSPWTSGMTATPVSKPDRPSASLGKSSRATPIITSGLPCCGEQRLPPVGDDAAGAAATWYEADADDDDVQQQVDARPARRRCRSPP